MRESKIAATDRLRREGRWDQASQYRDEARERLRAEGLNKREANRGAWREMIEKFPPLKPEPHTTESPDEPDAEEAEDDPVDLDALFDQADGGPPNIARDTRWVYLNVENKVVTPSDAPTPGAWSFLQWARKYPKRFYEQLLPKAIPSDWEHEEENPRYDNGKSLEELLGAFERDMEKLRRPFEISLRRQDRLIWCPHCNEKLVVPRPTPVYDKNAPFEPATLVDPDHPLANEQPTEDVAYVPTAQLWEEHVADLEKQAEEQRSRAQDNHTSDLAGDVLWVYRNLEKKNLKAAAAPNLGAWGLWKWARAYPNRFFEQLVPKATEHQKAQRPTRTRPVMEDFERRQMRRDWNELDETIDRLICTTDRDIDCPACQAKILLPEPPGMRGGHDQYPAPVLRTAGKTLAKGAGQQRRGRKGAGGSAGGRQGAGAGRAE